MSAIIENSSVEHSLDNVDKTLNNADSKKQDRRLRMRKSIAPKFSSKSESSGSSSDTPSHEECDACGGTEGGLVTCDSCYGAYHIDCLNPSLSEEEMRKTQDMDFCCRECSNEKSESRENSTELSPSSSDMVELENSPRRSPRVSRGVDSPAASLLSKRKRSGKNHRETCETCDQFGDDLIACITCTKTFHSYCLDPPLLKKPTHWQCPDHKADVAFIPRQTFKLNFTPKDWIMNDSKRASSLDTPSVPATDTQCDDERDTSLQANKRLRTKPNHSTETEQSTEILMMLRHSKIFEPESIELTQDDDCPISPEVLNDLSPMFIKFLAWQRLKDMYRESQRKQSHATNSL